MKIRTLIVDDEPLARRGIQSRLQQAPDFEVVGACAHGREAVASIQAASPDLVFLDVQMPGMGGFEVIDAIGPDAMPAVIFITAYDQHALRAFDVHALDYLLKPIDDDRFFLALDRIRAHRRQQEEGALGRRFSALLADIAPTAGGEQDQRAVDQADETTRRFVVKSGGRIFFVKAEEIAWIEAAGDYVCLHVGSKSHLLRKTMTAMEAQLDPERFLRIHRSTIVNAEYIDELQPYFNGEYIVILRDGTQLKLSRSYRERLQAFFDGAL